MLMEVEWPTLGHFLRMWPAMGHPARYLPLSPDPHSRLSGRIHTCTATTGATCILPILLASLLSFKKSSTVNAIRGRAGQAKSRPFQQDMHGIREERDSAGQGTHRSEAMRSVWSGQSPTASNPVPP